MKYKILFFCAAVLSTGLPSDYTVTYAHAENNGMTLLKHRCVSCHNLTGPAPHTLADLQSRKGPDLFYAGNKYHREWLKNWLQHPTRIRPAGMFYALHIKSEAQADIIDSSTLPAHIALTASDASLATDALMQLKLETLRIKAILQQQDVISEILPRGRMLFNHVYGCIACHQTAPGHGGLSGSELYSAANRMTAAFMRSYIRDPKLWNPQISMPNIHASGENIEKLIRYIMSLSAHGRNANVNTNTFTNKAM